jgi:PEP-CTERM motif
MKRLLVLLLVLSAGSVYGAFSIQLDAGQLKVNATTSMSTGSLLIFITAGPDGIFETPNSLKAGSFVAGDDVILSVISDPPSGSAFNTTGGTNETLNLFAITNVTPPTGQLLGLMWFPGITLTQWQAGATPTAGQVFGFYNPTFYGNATSNPDGGNTWTVPSAGSLINLNFFTTDSSGGGTQLPSEGFADFIVSAVPEPSTWSLLGLGGLSSVGLTLLRARRRKS